MDRNIDKISRSGRIGVSSAELQHRELIAKEIEKNLARSGEPTKVPSKMRDLLDVSVNISRNIGKVIHDDRVNKAGVAAIQFYKSRKDRAAMSADPVEYFDRINNQQFMADVEDRLEKFGKGYDKLLPKYKRGILATLNKQYAADLKKARRDAATYASKERHRYITDMSKKIKSSIATTGTISDELKMELTNLEKTFEGDENMLRMLELSYRGATGEAVVDDVDNSYNIKAAEKALKVLTKSNLYSPAQLKRYRKKIDSAKENLDDNMVKMFKFSRFEQLKRTMILNPKTNASQMYTKFFADIGSRLSKGEGLDKVNPESYFDNPRFKGSDEQKREIIDSMRTLMDTNPGELVQDMIGAEAWEKLGVRDRQAVANGRATTNTEAQVLTAQITALSHDPVRFKAFLDKTYTDRGKVEGQLYLMDSLKYMESIRRKMTPEGRAKNSALVAHIATDGLLDATEAVTAATRGNTEVSDRNLTNLASYASRASAALEYAAAIKQLPGGDSIIRALTVTANDPKHNINQTGLDDGQKIDNAKAFTQEFYPAIKDLSEKLFNEENGIYQTLTNSDGSRAYIPREALKLYGKKGLANFEAFEDALARGALAKSGRLHASQKDMDTVLRPDREGGYIIMVKEDHAAWNPFTTQNTYKRALGKDGKPIKVTPAMIATMGARLLNGK